jgi:hypothetical protein
MKLVASAGSNVVHFNWQHGFSWGQIIRRERYGLQIGEFHIGQLHLACSMNHCEQKAYLIRDLFVLLHFYLP